MEENSWHQKLNGAVLMDLPNAFDDINHKLLIAKLQVYEFFKDVLKKIVLCQAVGKEARLINRLFSRLQY